MVKTNISDQLRQTPAEEAVSVIHAPESFQSWVGGKLISSTWHLLTITGRLGYNVQDIGNYPEDFA